MLARITRTVAVFTLFLGSGAAAASASIPPAGTEEGEYTECADYISSGPGETPLTGVLLGVTHDGPQDWGEWGCLPPDELGLYLMSDGTLLWISCVSYTVY